jgi:ankyrin repeat protein
MYSKFRTASLLLERGADVNATDSDGIQPLFWAVILFDEPLAKLLLEHGAQINHRDRSGRTVLWWAVGQPNRQKAEMVRFLLEHRADPSLPDRHGVSPLKRASGEVKIIRLLKQAGAKK